MKYIYLFIIKLNNIILYYQSYINNTYNNDSHTRIREK